MNKIVEPVLNVNDVSRISSGTVIKGEISSDSDIRVDGVVDGKMYSKGKIVVGETAVLKGDLLCNVVDLWGKMDGDIYVKDVLSVKNSAVINGNIYVRKFQVEMGAQINGSCHMISEAEYDKYVASVVSTKPSAKETLSQKVSQ
ncbi:MAG: polymer-forming cytoskeletal protein [Candidatus Cryptobacteroides sp.]|nr:polymer-forming cytoskeletal protein [Candidatus Cryptobacteroides sp.]